MDLNEHDHVPELEITNRETGEKFDPNTAGYRQGIPYGRARLGNLKHKFILRNMSSDNEIVYTDTLAAGDTISLKIVDIALVNETGVPEIHVYVERK